MYQPPSSGRSSRAGSLVMPCVRNVSSRSRSSGSRTVIAPPSPVVTVLTGWKEKTLMSAWAASPTGPSGRREPSACAASSISTTSSPIAARISATGAGRPVKLTGITARVRSVSDAEIVSALTL